MQRCHEIHTQNLTHRERGDRSHCITNKNLYFSIKTLRFHHHRKDKNKITKKSYFEIERNSVVRDEFSTDGDDGICRVSSPKFSSPLVLSVESK